MDPNARPFGDDGDSSLDDLLGGRDEDRSTIETPSALDGPAPQEEPSSPADAPEDAQTDARADAPADAPEDLGVPSAPAAAAVPEPAPQGQLPSAQQFQDVIALRREAEEAAAAALEERREATAQASRIIEEAMRAAEALHADAQQGLDARRSAADAEAQRIVELAREEAAEIVKRGEDDVLEAQRLRREATAERERLNSELERIRRTAQEELFAEANRHTARMEEIRTRVLHGVEAVTAEIRGGERREPDALPGHVEPAPRHGAAPSYVVPPAAAADPAPVPTQPVVIDPPAAEPAATNPPVSRTERYSPLDDPAPVISPVITPVITPAPPVQPTRTDPAGEAPDRSRRGWRSRRP